MIYIVTIIWDLKKKPNYFTSNSISTKSSCIQDPHAATHYSVAKTALQNSWPPSTGTTVNQHKHEISKNKRENSTCTCNFNHRRKWKGEIKEMEDNTVENSKHLFSPSIAQSTAVCSWTAHSSIALLLIHVHVSPVWLHGMPFPVIHSLFPISTVHWSLSAAPILSPKYMYMLQGICETRDFVILEISWNP